MSMDNLSALSVFIPRESSPEGGVSSHIETLVRSLPENIQPNYYFLPKTHRLRKGILWAGSGFSMSRARSHHLQHRIRLIEDWLRKSIQTDYCLIHVHDVIAGEAALRFREKFSGKCSIVCTIHGPLSREIRMDLKDEQFADSIYLMESEVYNQMDRLIAVDQGQKDIIVNEFNVHAHRVTVIVNAVAAQEVEQLSLTSLTNSLGEEMLERRKKCRVLLVLPRRLVEKNGPLVALRALKLLDQDVHLWVVGDGPLRASFEVEIDQLGLGSRVWLLGAQPRHQSISAMSLADAVLIPSVPSHGVVEATSIAALEGMALGKTVIASNIGGLSELIRHGHNGLLFEAGDHEALAELVRSAKSIDKQKIGSTAKTFVTEVWSAQVWVDKIIEIYKSVGSTIL
jgi:glycosyltransferase involved in cell wall biosynthesis